MKRYLLAAFLLLIASNVANAACGFGATFGTGSTDSISTGYSTLTSSTRSYNIWIWINDAGGGSLGRIFDASPTLDASYMNTGTSTIAYQRNFSVTNGQWTVTAPATGGYHSLGIAYDASSISNNPVIYVDGVSVSVTSVAPPVGTAVTTSGTYVIGNRLVTPTRNFGGKLRDFSMWSGILSANEFKALANGASPLNIRQTSLLVYSPCFRTTAGQVDWGPSRLAQTVTGTARVNDPPVTLYPLEKNAP